MGPVVEFKVSARVLCELTFSESGDIDPLTAADVCLVSLRVSNGAGVLFGDSLRIALQLRPLLAGPAAPLYGSGSAAVTRIMGPGDDAKSPKSSTTSDSSDNGSAAADSASEAGTSDANSHSEHDADMLESEAADIAAVHRRYVELSKQRKEALRDLAPRSKMRNESPG
jgi:hypothetical protein